MDVVIIAFFAFLAIDSIANAWGSRCSCRSKDEEDK